MLVIQYADDRFSLYSVCVAECDRKALQFDDLEVGTSTGGKIKFSLEVLLPFPGIIICGSIKITTLMC